MKVQGVIALAAGMLISTTSAAVAFRATTVALGEVKFGTPSCGDANRQNISTSDCATAISEMLAANCVNGLCTVPAAAPEASESIIEQTFGACQVFVGVFVGGSAATFTEDAVQAAFPTFISECIAPTNKAGFGNPILQSTDGRLRLGFSNGIPVGPE
jgi:hypothetical protein